MSHSPTELAAQQPASRCPFPQSRAPAGPTAPFAQQGPRRTWPTVNSTTCVRVGEGDLPRPACLGTTGTRSNLRWSSRYARGFCPTDSGLTLAGGGSREGKARLAGRSERERAIAKHAGALLCSVCRPADSRPRLDQHRRNPGQVLLERATDHRQLTSTARVWPPPCRRPLFEVRPARSVLCSHGPTSRSRPELPPKPAVPLGSCRSATPRRAQGGRVATQAADKPPLAPARVGASLVGGT